MTRDIHLTYRKGGMTPDDAAISVTVCFAPFDRVLALAAGVHRARWGATFVTEGETASPHAIHDRNRTKAAMTRAATGARNLFSTWGLTISTPEAKPDITLIEHWGNEGIVSDMFRLEPDLPNVEIYSLFDCATREQHAFAVRNGSRTIRRVAVSRGFDTRGWHWEEDGETQSYERPERYRATSVKARLDRELLFDYARALGVDMQACLAHRHLARSAHIEKMNPSDPTDAREPTRLGQGAYEAAVAAGIGEGWPEQSGPERQQEALSAQKAMAISSTAKDRILKAGDADEIAAILREASDEMAEFSSASGIAPDIGRLALSAAYRKDVDSLATRRLERQIVDLTANSDWPVTTKEIEKRRAEARPRLVLNPLAKRHDRLCKTAKQPSDLLPIVDDVTSGRIPEVDERFRETAVELAFRRALALCPDDPVTEELGQLVDRLRAESTYWSQFGIGGSYALAVRNHENGLRQRREAAARKRAARKSGNANT